MARLLHIDGDAFSVAFARRCLKVRHELTDHPLFSTAAIAELADELPAPSVRRERGDLPVVNPSGYAEAGLGRPSETVRTIAENGLRVSLRDIQQSPQYAELINRCLDEAAPLVSEREGGMIHRAGYLFITAPAATTPMHFDAEHSFLLQIKGRKRVYSAEFPDANMTQRELERFFDGAPADFEAMQRHATETVIGPGEGVYIPSFIPHWVETDEGESVSFSIPFFTPYAERASMVNRINSKLRKLKLPAKPPGRSPREDKVKALVMRALLRLRGSEKKVWA